MYVLFVFCRCVRELFFFILNLISTLMMLAALYYRYSALWGLNGKAILKTELNWWSTITTRILLLFFVLFENAYMYVRATSTTQILYNFYTHTIAYYIHIIPLLHYIYFAPINIKLKILVFVRVYTCLCKKLYRIAIML